VRGWLAASLASWAAALTWHAAVGSDEGGGRGRARARRRGGMQRRAGLAAPVPLAWRLACAGDWSALAMPAGERAESERRSGETSGPRPRPRLSRGPKGVLRRLERVEH
jgi:hypothetical protein